jgi:hypothetical protein
MPQDVISLCSVNCPLDLYDPGNFSHSVEHATVRPNPFCNAKCEEVWGESGGRVILYEAGGPPRPRPVNQLAYTHNLCLDLAKERTEATTEIRPELSRRRALLSALASITAPVAALTLATGSTTSTGTGTLAITAHHAARRRVRALLLDVGLGHDLGREVEPFAEVVETLRGEGVVV